MAEENKDQNWLSQTGKQFTDLDFRELGVPDDLIHKQGFNRAMLDIVHAENMEGYIKLGMSEAEARSKADARRSQAIQAAKANGLKM